MFEGPISNKKGKRNMGRLWQKIFLERYAPYNPLCTHNDNNNNNNIVSHSTNYRFYRVTY